MGLNNILQPIIGRVWIRVSNHMMRNNIFWGSIHRGWTSSSSSSTGTIRCRRVNTGSSHWPPRGWTLAVLWSNFEGHRDGGRMDNWKQYKDRKAARRRYHCCTTTGDGGERTVAALPRREVKNEDKTWQLYRQPFIMFLTDDWTIMVFSGWHNWSSSYHLFVTTV